MNNIKENNREEKLSQHKFVGNLYDFSNISFTDEIDSKNFKSIVQETVNRCFNDNIHLAYMDEISAYITILKYFSNFPVEEFTDDELYMICLYSNLRECIDKTKITNPDNKLFFPDTISISDNQGLYETCALNQENFMKITESEYEGGPC